MVQCAEENTRGTKMKKLLLVALLSMSGCVLIDSYNMARFDNVEYMQINNIRTVANLGVDKCGTADVNTVVDSLYFSSVALKNYSSNISHNVATAKMTNELVVITKELSDRYNGTEAVSTAYCKLKFGVIEKNAVTMQKVIGDKPR